MPIYICGAKTGKERKMKFALQTFLSTAHPHYIADVRKKSISKIDIFSLTFYRRHENVWDAFSNPSGNRTMEERKPCIPPSITWHLSIRQKYQQVPFFFRMSFPLLPLPAMPPRQLPGPGLPPDRNSVGMNRFSCIQVCNQYVPQ